MARGEKLLGNSIAREQFLLNEGRIVARLRLSGLSEKEATARVKEENLFRYPTTRYLGKISRACNKRFDALDDRRLQETLAEGLPNAAAQVNLYGMMQTYSLVRHFMVTTVAPKLDELSPTLSSEDMNAYFTRLACDYDNFATAAESTTTKLKQVLRKCLREAGMLEGDRVMPATLDPTLRAVLEERGDLQALRAFVGEGGL